MFEQALSFDDVLLVPRRSSIHSRKDIDLETELFKGYSISSPIISANMPSVTGPLMAYKIWKSGGFGILHRFNKIDEAVDDFYYLKDRESDCGVSLGVGEDTGRRYERLYQAGARIFCVDIAHGHHDRAIDMTRVVKNWYKDVFVIAGNVATYEGAYDLAEAGADAIKIGIGPGAACTTREVTGFGVPQVTAIASVKQVKDDFPHVRLISDGGIKNSGDIVKALAFGADTVMIGRLFAGCIETPYPGWYYGNASRRVRDYNAPEGIEGEVEQTGSVEDVMKQLKWGIKSGLSYAGCQSIYDLHEDPVEFTIVSSQTMHETRTRI